MISSILDIVLLAALAGTSGAVLLMYRRLQRFDALQNEAAKEFARSSEALDRAREAIVGLHADSGDMVVTLAARLNEARMVINDIDDATLRTHAAINIESGGTTSAAIELPGTLNQLPGNQPASAATAAEQFADARTITQRSDALPWQTSSTLSVKAAPSTTAMADPIDGLGLEPYVDDAVEAPAMSAAIRIRNAARGRIEAARLKAGPRLDATFGVTPQPTPAPLPAVAPRLPVVPSSMPPRLPEMNLPRIHREKNGPNPLHADVSGRTSGEAAIRVPLAPGMVVATNRAAGVGQIAHIIAGPDARSLPLPARLTWGDLARAAHQGG